MAAGKPIIASANGEIKSVIQESNAGFCADANDVLGFVECLKKFICCSNDNEMGINAKKYYEQNFSKKIVMDKLEKILFEYSM